MNPAQGRRGRKLAVVCVVVLLLVASVIVRFSRSPSIAVESSPAPMIADTDHSPPPGAIFVATDGDDSAAGTEQSPYKTLKRAVGAAPAGATIVLRAGDYREAAGVLAKRLTLQPFPHEQVWLKGSLVVTGWVQEGSRWRKDNWTYKLPRTGCPTQTLDPATNPLACYSDMVFVGGEPLKQVSSLQAVSPGTFFADQAKKKLYIGTNPVGKTVEASVFAQAFELAAGATGSVVRGLGFAHYAPPYQNSALRIQANDVTFENNTVAYSAMFGVGISGDGGILRGNTISHNGLVGLGGSTPNDLLVEGNIFAYNNYERFNRGWEAAGVKLVRMQRATVRDNTFINNFAKGFWCDGSCYDLMFIRNLLEQNDVGISFEISHKAVIASNLFVDSRKGMSIGSSSAVRIYNNTFSAIDELDVHVYQGLPRDNSPTPEEQALGIAWITNDIEIKNNIFSNGIRLAFLQVNDQRNQRSGRELAEELDHNGYYRAAATKPPGVARLGLVGGGIETIKTVPELQSKTGKEAHGFRIDGSSVNPFFVDESGGDYRLKPDSPGRGAAAPLPDDIAAAIGAPAEARDLGAITWPPRPPSEAGVGPRR